MHILAVRANAGTHSPRAFGTPVDITLSELTLETFFPADDFTAERMRKMAARLN